MPVLKNDLVSVELDPRWPRTVRLARLDTGGSVAGCRPEQPFALELNGRLIAESEMRCRAEASAAAADYVVEIEALRLALRFRFVLDGCELVLTLPEVRERGAFRLEKLYLPDHDLVTGAAAAGDSFLRHVTRRRNWSAAWCPGTATYDQWEDWGAVGGAAPERGAQYTNHACVWNDKLCAAVACSTFVEPLMTALRAESSVKSGRAGQFSIWAGTYSHRLRGQPAKPLEVRVGLLGDYDRNGKIDWCDAANWEGDKLPKPLPLYREALVYKVRVGSEGEPFAARSFADCLPIIRAIHEISEGLPQVVYLVGWQYDGHDTGYPSLAVVNPKCGGRDALARLIRDAKAFNAVVSLHINLDSCYQIHPEWREDCVSRDEQPGGRGPHVWYSKPYRGDRKVYSMNHTCDLESGFLQDRLDRLCAMLPLEKSIHSDAFRPYGEAWLRDGSHIDAECEVQRGIIPILDAFRRKGLDITTEDSDDEKRGLFSWVLHQSHWLHPYKMVLCHGRLLGANRTGHRGGKGAHAPEAVALGLSIIMSEDGEARQAMTANFYLHWMYSQLLLRKKMSGYQPGDWNIGLRAWYEDDTWIHGEYYPHKMEAWYEGIPIAREDSRFLPWRDDVIYAFSKDGGPQEWTLPKAWEGARIAAQVLRPGGPLPFDGFKVAGRKISFPAPAGMAIKFTRSST